MFPRPLGGDIFVHAKSDSYSKLFELCDRVISQLPAGSVDRYEDIYGWVYRNGRDLSGFIDGMLLNGFYTERFDLLIMIHNRKFHL